MRRTNFYVDPAKLQALKMLAASEDVSVSDLVRDAIDAMIAERLASHEFTKGKVPAASLRSKLDDVLRRIDSKLPQGRSQGEIERDVGEAISEVRSERALRRRRRTARPPIGKGE